KISGPLLRPRFTSLSRVRIRYKRYQIDRRRHHRDIERTYGGWRLPYERSQQCPPALPAVPGSPEHHSPTNRPLSSPSSRPLPSRLATPPRPCFITDIQQPSAPPRASLPSSLAPMPTIVS